MMNETKRVLAVGAHPDDIEIFCAGTLLLLQEHGYELHMATLTLGDCGSKTLSPDQIRRIRQNEAETACGKAGAVYHYVGLHDFDIYNTDHSNRLVAGLMREVDPAIVFTHSPQDYLTDHETTSLLVRNTCFYAAAPNYDTPSRVGRSSSSGIPHLFYSQPMEGIDLYGCEVIPQFYVDVSSVFERKLEMLECHESQRNWLRDHHGIDEYIDSTRRWHQYSGRRVTELCGRTVSYAEGYRQHRGHAYPRENVLAELLGELVQCEPRWSNFS
jgi:LmbE family N-acetylglucosaminyl deacetylase